MTFTKQPRSLPIMDDPDSKSIQSFSICPAKAADTETAEIVKGLFSVQCGLNDLYKKLNKLNSLIIQHKEKGEMNEN